MPRLTTHAARLLLDGSPWAMRAGELHYFRTARQGWEKSLGRMRRLGFNTVTTYIPWMWHAPVPGRYDFSGATDRRRDLQGFLRAAQAEGLVVVARPGPFIYAEYEGLGHPRWLAGQIPQARMLGPGGRPIGGTFWEGYTSTHPDYLAAVREWYGAVAVILAEFWERPVVAWQVDNETGIMQMDGLGRLDWNPHTLAAYQQWLQAQYPDLATLNHAWSTRHRTWAAIAPPRPPFAQGPVNSWQHFLEDATLDTLTTLIGLSREVGVPVPISANEAGLALSPCAPARKARLPGIDLYGYDLYLKMSSRPAPTDFPWANAYTPALFRALLPPDRPLLCWELGVGWFDPRTTLSDAVAVQNILGGLGAGLAGYSIYPVQDAVEADGHTYAYQTVWQADGTPGPRHAIVGRLLAVGADHDPTPPTPNPQPPTPSPPVGFAFYQPDSRFAAEDYLPGLALHDPARALAGLAGATGVFGALAAAGYGPQLRVLDLEEASTEEWAACPVLVLVSKGRLDAATYNKLRGYVAAGGHLITCGRTPHRTLDGGPLACSHLYPHPPAPAHYPNRARLLRTLAHRWGIEYLLRDRAALADDHPTSLHILDTIAPLLAAFDTPSQAIPLRGRGPGLLRGDLVLETYPHAPGAFLWQRGVPVAYRAWHGKGSSTMIGTLVGGLYSTPAYYDLSAGTRGGIRAFWTGVLQERGVAPAVRAHAGLEVGVQQQMTTDGRLLVITNYRAEPQEGTLHLTHPITHLAVLFAGVASEVRQDRGGLALRLAAGDAVMLRVELMEDEAQASGG